MKRGTQTGWEVMEDWAGNIHQAGIQSTPEEAHEDIESTMGFMIRAVVLATYYADQDPRPGTAVGNQRNILCDVRTYGRYSRELPKVPVMQLTHGIHDEDWYIPRTTRQRIDGGELSTGPATDTGKPPTPAELMDGDHVVVGFMDNNPRFPVILPFTLGHPQATRRPTSDQGRRRRIRHAGTVLEWDEAGNWTLDASGASQEVLGPAATEQATGQAVVTIKADDKAELTLDQFSKLATLNADQVRLGGLNSGNPLVLGNEFRQMMLDMIAAIGTLIVGTGVGPSTPPINTSAAFAGITAQLNANAPLSDFVFTQKVPD